MNIKMVQKILKYPTIRVTLTFLTSLKLKQLYRNTIELFSVIFLSNIVGHAINDNLMIIYHSITVCDKFIF